MGDNRPSVISPSAEDPESAADTHFLSILPFGLKPQFDTTHWVPHGSANHPGVGVTARSIASTTGTGGALATGKSSAATPNAGSGMSFMDSKHLSPAPPPKGAIAIVKDLEVSSMTAELTTVVRSMEIGLFARNWNHVVYCISNSFSLFVMAHNS
jgi:hypothetical protein